MQKQPNDDKQAALRKVYREFDLDGGGGVGEDELLMLGQARRKMGQKGGERTKEMNDKLMKRMGVDNNGSVSETNFVEYFDGALSMESSAFNMAMVQFMESAKECSQLKIEEKKSSKKKAKPKAELTSLEKRLENIRV